MLFKLIKVHFLVSELYWESNLKQTKVVYFKILSIHHSQLLQCKWVRFVKWIRETDKTLRSLIYYLPSATRIL